MKITLTFDLFLPKSHRNPIHVLALRNGRWFLPLLMSLRVTLAWTRSDPSIGDFRNN